jgi:hypothetical protein
VILGRLAPTVPPVRFLFSIIGKESKGVTASLVPPIGSTTSYREGTLFRKTRVSALLAMARQSDIRSLSCLRSEADTDDFLDVVPESHAGKS